MSLLAKQRDTIFRQALIARDEKDIGKTAALLYRLTIDAPEFAPAFTEMGLLLADTGRAQQAITYFQSAVELAPDDVNCLWAFGDFLRKHNEWSRAYSYFGEAAKLAPHNLSILQGFLSTQRMLQDHVGILKTTQCILNIQPDNLMVAAIRGEALSSLGKTQEALTQFEALLEYKNSPPLVLERWADLMIRLDRTAELVSWLIDKISRDSSCTELLLLLSSAYVSMGRHTDAIDTLEKAYQLQPDNMRVMHNIAVVMRFLGKTCESKQWFERMLEHDPFHAHALRLFGEEHTYESGDYAFVRLETAAKSAVNELLENQTQLFYALGKAYDDIGDYETAVRHYISAGKARLIQYPNRGESVDEHIKLVRHAFSSPVSKAQELGFDSNRPIFVLGMPRSGTSLVEQILASHPDVFGAGEITHLERAIDGIQFNGTSFEMGTKNPFFSREYAASNYERGEKYIQALSLYADTDAKRVIDKLPGNFLWAGFIPLILPKSKIIHCKRHPVETCLSAFRNFFIEGHLYSCDLARLGKYYRRYDELMSFWRSTIPSDILFGVRYEDIVLDQENQTRRLIDFVGLEWNDSCLSFHVNPRAVSTASALQIRKPLYKTSINRWRKYEPYLKPLLDELAPLIKKYEQEL